MENKVNVISQNVTFNSSPVDRKITFNFSVLNISTGQYEPCSFSIDDIGPASKITSASVINGALLFTGELIPPASAEIKLKYDVLDSNKVACGIVLLHSFLDDGGQEDDEHVASASGKSISTMTVRSSGMYRGMFQIRAYFYQNTAIYYQPIFMANK